MSSGIGLELSEQIRTYDFGQVAVIVLMILVAVATDLVCGKLRFATIGRQQTPNWAPVTGRGTLILVVGPSGAGKDSIIAAAAAQLRAEPRILFARRLITRPAEAGGEDHIAVSPAAFSRARDAGELMLSWQAHRLDYGLPGELAAALVEGKCVVANVSRAVVAEARQRFAPVLVVAVTASPETLAARLAGRGRETAADIETRLRRGGAAVAADVVIDNDGTLEAAVARFTPALRNAIGWRA